jgi:hypothetical protein
MKTLENPDDKKELLERLAELRGDSARVWGRMCAPQMVSHLSDSCRLISGEKPASSVENLFTRTVVKWLALRLPVPWSRGLRTMPEIDQQIGGPLGTLRGRQSTTGVLNRTVCRQACVPCRCAASVLVRNGALGLSPYGPPPAAVRLLGASRRARDIHVGRQTFFLMEDFHDRLVEVRAHLVPLLRARDVAHDDLHA